MSTPSCCLVSHTLQAGIGPADANRLLAVELAKRGYRVSLCGLNDSNASAIREGELDIHGIQFSTLEIPQAIEWSARCDRVRDFLAKEKSEHVLFRFIPFSLNTKGIVWEAGNSLPTALRGTEVIWLIDEIWLGEGPTTFKHRLVGILQRYCILRLLNGVRSRRIYTNNRFNTKALRQRRIHAETLRLFGNIPVVAADGSEWLFHEFESAGIPIKAANRGRWLILGNFGVFHSDWNPTSFLSQLRDLAGRREMQVCIVGIGSLGSYEDHWQSVGRTWGDDFSFLHLGRRTEVEVSQFLQSVDYGITTNPYYLVGKSGTCMAMLDHGLPLIVPRITDYDDPTEFPAHLVLRCGDSVGDELFTRRGSSVPDPQLPRAVDELIAAMSALR